MVLISAMNSIGAINLKLYGLSEFGKYCASYLDVKKAVKLGTNYFPVPPLTVHSTTFCLVIVEIECDMYI